MRFFGQRWEAPATEGKEFEPAPVGAECLHGCGQPITEGDTGVILPMLLGKYGQQWAAYHKACFFEEIGYPEGAAA